MTWTDRHSAWMIPCFFIVVLLVFFSPRMRYDGILYVNPARSLLFDGDLNTYNESAYYSQPGWNSVQHRNITGRRPIFVKYVNAPDYTSRGYRHVVFPIGGALTWLPPLMIGHGFMSVFHLFQPSPIDDGYSLPYLLILGWWSIVLGFIGCIAAYRLLRMWYSPGISCFAVIFIIAAGNLIPFMTVDVTFSHVIDFTVINLLCLVCTIMVREPAEPATQAAAASWPLHALAGFLSGWAVITRYQDITLLILPLAIYARYGIFRRQSRKTDAGRFSRLDFPAFLLSFLLTVGLQLIYWKILYGRFMVSGTLMGTGGLPSFNLMNPDILPMLFSRFHGLFSWMPWLLPLAVAALFFVRREPMLGGAFLLIFLSQCYYNSSRSEWWNLGFSVRRFSGWSIVFMVGAAEAATLFRRYRMRVAGMIVCGCILIWHWIFLIHYTMGNAPGSILPALMKGLGPYGAVDYGVVLPDVDLFLQGIRGVSTWFTSHSWMQYVQYWNQSGRPAATIALLTGQITVAIFLFGISRVGIHLQKVPLRRLSIIAAVCVTGAGMFMGLSDAGTEAIQAAVVNQGKPTGEWRSIRIRQGRPFLGENAFVSLNRQGQSFAFEPGTAAGGCDWLIGLPPGTGSSDGVVVEFDGPGDAAGIVHIHSDAPDIRRLYYPWGLTVYRYEWYWGHLPLKIPAGEAFSLTIRVLDGPDVCLGALYTRS